MTTSNRSPSTLRRTGFLLLGFAFATGVAATVRGTSAARECGTGIVSPRRGPRTSQPSVGNAVVSASEPTPPESAGIDSVEEASGTGTAEPRADLAASTDEPGMLGVRPVSYWNFEGVIDSDEPLLDKAGGGNSLHGGPGLAGIASADDSVGQFARLRPEAVDPAPEPLGRRRTTGLHGFRQLSVEFLFRVPDPRKLCYGPRTEGASRPRRPYLILLGREFGWRLFFYWEEGALALTVPVRDDANTVTTETLRIDLGGIGRASLDYYTDRRWHHVVATYDGIDGRAEIWIDGQCPEGFARAARRGTVTSVGDDSDFLNLGGMGHTAFHGDLDEVAIYAAVVPPAQVYQHFLDAIRDRRPYSFRRSGAPRPVAEPVVPGFDPRDFAIDYQPPASQEGIAGYVPARASALRQLSSYPDPRYPSDCRLRRLDYWGGDAHVIGGALPTPYPRGDTRPLEEAQRIWAELYRRWHYHLPLGSLELNHFALSPVTETMIELARSPECADWELSLHSYSSGFFRWENGAKVAPLSKNNEGLPDRYYCQTSDGTPIVTDAGKVLSPGSDEAQRLAREGGMFMRAGLERILATLGEREAQRIRLVSENGEVEPVNVVARPGYDPAVDPTTVGDPLLRVLLAVHANEPDGERRARWKYFSRRKVEDFDLAYRDEFMARLPWATFNQYEVAGYAADCGGERSMWSKPTGWQWLNLKRVSQHSVPDFYPDRGTLRWYWGPGVTGVTGWQFLAVCRRNELEGDEGHRTYWPSVAAGWNFDETRNIRPGRWLGLLKSLMATGAASFYAGHFTDAPRRVPSGDPQDPWNNLYPDPGDWVWQMAMPAYAQAVGARAQEFLLRGDLLPGDVRNPLKDGDRMFAFAGGDLGTLVVVRRWEGRLLIVATKQHGAVEGPFVLEDAPAGGGGWQLGGAEPIGPLHLTARRQGSVYVYDPAEGTLVMLDSWHEPTHPEWWSTHRRFEAEVTDGRSVDGLRTWRLRTDHAGPDYTRFVTYMEAVGPDRILPAPGERPGRQAVLEYRFRVLSDQAGREHVLYLRARTRRGAAAVRVGCRATPDRWVGEPARVMVLGGRDWTWYGGSAGDGDEGNRAGIPLSALPEGDYTVEVEMLDAGVELDQLLVADETLIHPLER